MAIAVTCNAPPNGEIGVPYSHFFPVTGETGTVVWSISAGALPPGLTINTATGEVSGTPTAPAAIANFTVLVTDDAPSESSVPCSIGIVDAVGITCDNPPEGTVGTPYSHFFPASGGIAPYAFFLVDGDFPDGLTLDPVTGEVSGTPTVAGTFAFTIQVEDDLGATSEVECEIGIALLGPVVQCNNPPVGKINVPYTHDLFAFGGIPPYTWEISMGVLPTGLSLGAATGVISGTPTTSGTFFFRVLITDSGDATATVDCSIQIKACLVGSGA